MLNVTFSNELFTQLGGTNWITRPGKFNLKPAETPGIRQAKEAMPKENAVEIDSVDETQLHESEPGEQLNGIVEEVMVEDKHLSAMSTPSHLTEGLPVLSIVVIGAGLESVWQNEESLAWQLWQNIMKAFDWDENQVVFFDTEHLVTEDAIFSTMEGVIDLGVEWVLTMNEEHEISEQLAEGVQVVSVADFDQMLSDPYAKQSFYHSIISLGSS